MSRGTWNLIKHSKGFYISVYRKTGTMLAFSIALSLVLCFAIYYVHFNQSEPDFYATNGETPPIKLTPLDSANNTSVALLAADPEDNNDVKVIPQ